MTATFLGAWWTVLRTTSNWIPGLLAIGLWPLLGALDHGSHSDLSAFVASLAASTLVVAGWVVALQSQPSLRTLAGNWFGTIAPSRRPIEEWRIELSAAAGAAAGSILPAAFTLPTLFFSFHWTGATFTRQLAPALVTALLAVIALQWWTLLLARFLRRPALVLTTAAFVAATLARSGLHLLPFGSAIACLVFPLSLPGSTSEEGGCFELVARALGSGMLYDLALLFALLALAPGTREVGHAGRHPERRARERRSVARSSR